MDFRFSSLVVVLSSTLIITNFTYADGGANGALGYSSSSIVGSEEEGEIGIDFGYGDPNGGNGRNITGQSVSVGSVTGALLQITANAGGSGGHSSGYGGAGAGGSGGGSVIGGISAGGAGAYSEELNGSTNGGNGGSISNSVLAITNVQVNGANASGGAGGDVDNTSIRYGGAGAAGHGGGSVMGGISSGGAAGLSYPQPDSSPAQADAGDGGAISGNTITITDATFTGGVGGVGGKLADGYGASGAGGMGGGSVMGGISSGGAGGYTISDTSSADGGDGNNISANVINIKNTTMTGAIGGAGGNITATSPGVGGFGATGDGGHGGGSVFGGISAGGSGGVAFAEAGSTSQTSSSSAHGGDGGDISSNEIRLTAVTLNGKAGGNGGNNTNGSGGTGDAGHGGGSVFGGTSSGGAGGYSDSALSAADGGDGGAVYNNTIVITGSTLIGGAGGAASDMSSIYVGGGGGGGAAGFGGGSVFGGISIGGAGGVSSARTTSLPSVTDNAHGGDGGKVSGNTIRVTDSTLTGANGGVVGISRSGNPAGGIGIAGLNGGGVFGGVSYGGAGGFSETSTTSSSSNGGNGGDVTRNSITLSGTTKISGDIYGGYSHGGAAGYAAGQLGLHGKGGLTNYNMVTLVGEQLVIDGLVYGGQSIDGSGIVNTDSNFSSYYQGNTINFNAYVGSLKGIHNFENYNWVLPDDVTPQQVLVTMDANNKVNLNGTKHMVTMENSAVRLDIGDQVVLINEVTGTPAQTDSHIEQGQFIVYYANIEVVNNELILTIYDHDADGVSTEMNPKAKAFLEGRISSFLLVNEGADLISEHGVNAAHLKRESLDYQVFLVVDGGKSRYHTGSHVDLKDTKVALGVSRGFELANDDNVTVGVFFEHGDGRYDTYNKFVNGAVRGYGSTSYNGGGLLVQWDITRTERNDIVIGSNNGVYIVGAVRGGNVRTHFDSNDLTDGDGNRGEYRSRSNYYSIMAGAGYALSFTERHAADFYGRYTWAHYSNDKVIIANEALNLDAAISNRLRLGARYERYNSRFFMPYVGLAWEYEFSGDSSGSALGMNIDKATLNGSTGILELGVVNKPLSSYEYMTLSFNLSGYTGVREGVSGSVELGYKF